jgi:hypothetical protein
MLNGKPFTQENIMQNIYFPLFSPQSFAQEKNAVFSMQIKKTSSSCWWQLENEEIQRRATNIHLKIKCILYRE